MKIKEFQIVSREHKRFLGIISACGVKEPSLECHLVHALTHGQNLPLLSGPEISENARKAIAPCADNRWSSCGERSMKFADVFRVPASYVKADRDYTATKAATEKTARQYRVEAEAVLLKAEMDRKSVADEVLASLRAIAVKHGIKL